MAYQFLWKPETCLSFASRYYSYLQVGGNLREHDYYLKSIVRPIRIALKLITRTAWKKMIISWKVTSPGAAKTAKFNCFCCPNAVCGGCLCDANLAIVKVKRGFCGNCLRLAGLVEGITTVDFNEEKVNLSLQDSYEFLFKHYWDYIKEKEGMTSAHVNYARFLLNHNRNYDSNLSDTCVEGGEGEGLSDFEDQLIMSDGLDGAKEHKPSQSRKRIKGKPKEKSKTKEFLGWGSKRLFEFVTSIGQETNKKLSQHGVTTIISKYCRDNNLLDPLKKKKIICDEKLHTLLGRKFVNKNSIYKLLTNHFAENFEESENEFRNSEYSSDEEGRNVLSPCKRKKSPSLDRNSENKEAVLDIRQSCFASVIPRNIKLVYLQRSALEELSKQPETFDANVMGSFVRVKADPNDWMQRNSHQLVQVIGINKNSINGEMNSDIFLQLSNRVSDVPISEVSEDDFSEEECQDLHQRVKDGLLRRPTVVEFEEKARTLHEVLENLTIILGDVESIGCGSGSGWTLGDRVEALSGG
ncbi:unnamed protein product [Dovyalis caffra]|uniref:Uncharacterized protein n=1 Tax=Dovyalis caffra TaxID=77055 RepID=A0AAV1SJ53_9ROSI|nr:unnamed protein product [Dovyalis caffra]